MNRVGRVRLAGFHCRSSGAGLCQAVSAVLEPLVCQSGASKYSLGPPRLSFHATLAVISESCLRYRLVDI